MSSASNLLSALCAMLVILCFAFPNILSANTYDDEVIGVVEKRVITKSFVESVKDVFGFESYDDALDFIVNSYVILEFASKSGISLSRDEIDSLIEKIHKASIKEVEYELLKKGITLDEYRNLIKAKKISDELFFYVVGVNFISDEEILKFYNKNKDKIEKDFEKRYVLYKEIKSSGEKSDTEKRFYDVNEFSSLGWVRRGELMKQFDDAIFSLPSTGFSVINTDDGKKIIFFIKDIFKPDFSNLKDDPAFRDFYIKQKYKEVFERWVDAQKQKMFIEIKNKKLN
ncbi:Chaperone SurA [bacterium HR19]|nr:Chaperone SurA [bacterium HR19]